MSGRESERINAAKASSTYGPDPEARLLQAIELFRDWSIPEEELLQNLGLFINRPVLTRMLFLNELYRKIVPVAGVVMEFGCRWGRDLALFASLRGMYEPYNYSRRIVAFDTFEGFPSVGEQDMNSPYAVVGGYNVSPDYDAFLEAVLEYHESQSPMSEIRKFELVKGDMTETLPRYLAEHPETVVALAYFDVDLYEPTKAGLEVIRPYLTKGSVVAFDELCCTDWAGETAALREAWGLSTYRIERSSTHSLPTYCVIE